MTGGRNLTGAHLSDGRNPAGAVLSGTVLSGVGGKFRVETDDGSTLICNARGILRRGGERLLPGDRVTVECSGKAVNSGNVTTAQNLGDTVNSTELVTGARRDGSDGVISGLLPRKNELIRPPLANLDRIFASAYPEPSTLLADKLITIAEHEGIKPVIVISKRDLSQQSAERLHGIYTRCGFTVFDLSSLDGSGVNTLKNYITEECRDGITTFAGVSGAGKSTLLNALFPSLGLKTGELSERLSRGKNTTRTSELFPLASLLGLPRDGCRGYVADTPGFSLLDMERAEWISAERLDGCFREFAPYLGHCRFAGCRHMEERDCAVREAVARGEIAASRYESYRRMRLEVEKRPAWERRAEKP